MVRGWIGEDDPDELQKGEVDLNLILDLELDGDCLKEKNKTEHIQTSKPRA